MPVLWFSAVKCARTPSATAETGLGGSYLLIAPQVWKPFPLGRCFAGLWREGRPRGTEVCVCALRLAHSGPDRRACFRHGAEWLASPRAHAHQCGWCILPASVVLTPVSRKHLRACLSSTKSWNLRCVYRKECSFCVCSSPMWPLERQPRTELGWNEIGRASPTAYLERGSAPSCREFSLGIWT